MPDAPNIRFVVEVAGDPSKVRDTCDELQNFMQAEGFEVHSIFAEAARASTEEA